MSTLNGVECIYHEKMWSRHGTEEIGNEASSSTAYKSTIMIHTSDMVELFLLYCITTCGSASTVPYSSETLAILLVCFCDVYILQHTQNGDCWKKDNWFPQPQENPRLHFTYDIFHHFVSRVSFLYWYPLEESVVRPTHHRFCKMHSRMIPQIESNFLSIAVLLHFGIRAIPEVIGVLRLFQRALSPQRQKNRWWREAKSWRKQSRSCTERCTTWVSWDSPSRSHAVECCVLRIHPLHGVSRSHSDGQARVPVDAPLLLNWIRLYIVSNVVYCCSVCSR